MNIIAIKEIFKTQCGFYLPNHSDFSMKTWNEVDDDTAWDCDDELDDFFDDEFSEQKVGAVIDDVSFLDLDSMDVNLSKYDGKFKFISIDSILTILEKFIPPSYLEVTLPDSEDKEYYSIVKSNSGISFFK